MGWPHEAQSEWHLTTLLTNCHIDKNERPQSIVQRAEGTKLHEYSMQTSLQDNLPKCHPQDQSALYNTLPKEVRDLIFAFATAPFEDLAQKYDVDERYYRPGYRAPRKTSTTLLLTCRRIWLETNTLPMRQAVHSFWHEKGPPGKPSLHGTILSTLNQQNLTTVQLFLQLCVAENMLSDDNELDQLMYGLRPKVLRVTIRHSDWWDWEKYKPLELRSDGWVQGMLDQANAKAIERVQLELETLESTKSQLTPIVDKLKQLESSPRVLLPGSEHNRDQIHICLKPEDTSDVWHWSGSAGLKGNELRRGEPFTRPHQDLAKLDYHVEIVTWRSVRRSVDSSIDAEVYSDHQRSLLTPGPTQPRPIERQSPEVTLPHAQRWSIRRLLRRSDAAP